MRPCLSFIYFASFRQKCWPHGQYPKEMTAHRGPVGERLAVGQAPAPRNWMVMVPAPCVQVPTCRSHIDPELPPTPLGSDSDIPSVVEAAGVHKPAEQVNRGSGFPWHTCIADRR